MTPSTPASTCSSPRPSTGFRRTPPGRSSAATSPRSWNAPRRSSPTRTAATGSTSARRRSTCRCTATSWTAATWRRPSALVSAPCRWPQTSAWKTARRLRGPPFSTQGVIVKAGARIGPYTVLGKHCHVEEDASVRGSIVWANTPHRARGARRGCDSRTALSRRPRRRRGAGAMLGDKSVVTDWSRTTG